MIIIKFGKWGAITKWFSDYEGHRWERIFLFNKIWTPFCRFRKIHMPKNSPRVMKAFEETRDYLLSLPQDELIKQIESCEGGEISSMLLEAGYLDDMDLRAAVLIGDVDA